LLRHREVEAHVEEHGRAGEASVSAASSVSLARAPRRRRDRSRARDGVSTAELVAYARQLVALHRASADELATLDAEFRALLRQRRELVEHLHESEASHGPEILLAAERELLQQIQELDARLRVIGDCYADLNTNPPDVVNGGNRPAVPIMLAVDKLAHFCRMSPPEIARTLGLDERAVRLYTAGRSSAYARRLLAAPTTPILSLRRNWWTRHAERRKRK
jgi:hypothetical protein